MNKLILLVGVLLLTMGLFIYTNSHASLPFLSFGTTPTVTPANSRDNNQVVQLVIKDNKIVSGPQSFQVSQGKMVIFKIMADKSGLFHFNGYNKDVYLEKGKTVILSFLATVTGHFAYELAETKTVLGSIDVSP